jgi:acetyl esterase/lipase
MNVVRTVTAGLGLALMGWIPAIAQVKAVKDIPYVESSTDPMHRLDIYIPEGKTPAPVLFWVHGGSLTGDDRGSSDNAPVGERFAREGYVSVVISYRLSPQVTHPAHTEDVAKAFAWTVRNIAKHGGDPSKIVVSGHSAGAYLIGLLAYDRRYLQRENLSSDTMLALIPVSGFYFVDRVAPMPDRSRAVWGNDPQVWLSASPAQYVRKDAPRTILIYADGDEGWRRLDNEDFKAAVSKTGGRIESHQISGRTHMSILRRMPRPDDETTALMLKVMSSIIPAR